MKLPTLRTPRRPTAATEGSGRFRWGRAIIIIAVAVTMSPGARSQQEAPAPETAAGRHQKGVEFHNQRRLDEAGREYARALSLDPPRSPSAGELDTIRRFAPRVYTTPAEPFPLKDAAVVLHPTERLIAYHLFWEDDIDFPDDHDPCDHEVVWVRFASDGRSIERFWTYFHGRILEGGEASLRDAADHGMRPRVNVQWGKHGSLPAGWEQMQIVADAGDIESQYITLGTPISLADYNRGTWRKLRTDGRRMIEHPIARRLGWPDRFNGEWEQFVDFSRLVDPLSLIDRARMVGVSRWNSAIIDQHFLTYNFRPKTEWPPETAAAVAR